MKKAKSKLNLRKEADRVFSIYVRLRDRNSMGETFCYTCPKVADYKKMQNGHFVPRQYLTVRYDEVNCHAQCYACNMLYNGQPSAYALRLKKEWGKDIIEFLEIKRRGTIKLDYQLIIDTYTAKLEAMGMAYLV